MKFWDKFTSFDAALKAWEDNFEIGNRKTTESSKKNLDSNIIFQRPLRIKALLYLLKQDKDLSLLKNFSKFFFYHLKNILRSYLKKTPCILKDNLYLYNIDDFEEGKAGLSSKDTLFILGFSYCQKPIACPKKRFTCECIYDYENKTCSQCFIGKCINAMNKNDIYLIIPDIKYISEKLFEISYQNPNKNIFFVISSCSLSIKMFSDFANILKLQGIAIRLLGRVCLNYKSFLFAEKGLKNGLTYISDENEKTIFEILKIRWSIPKD
ncbi:MAG: hypothetical protein WCT85_06730 [Parachlamydiales bacterium]|jgi:hypothetical protein